MQHPSGHAGGFRGALEEVVPPLPVCLILRRRKKRRRNRGSSVGSGGSEPCERANGGKPSCRKSARMQDRLSQMQVAVAWDWHWPSPLVEENKNKCQAEDLQLSAGNASTGQTPSLQPRNQHPTVQD